MLPSQRPQRVYSSIFVENPYCCAVIFFRDAADRSDLHALDRAGNFRFRRRGKEQLVVFAAVKSEFQRRAAGDGQLAGIDHRRDAALFANMSQIDGESIAEINHCGGEAALAQPGSNPEPRFGKEMPAARSGTDLHAGKKLFQSRGRAAKLTGHVDEISGPRSGAQQRPSSGDLAEDNDIRRDLVGGRSITSGELHAEASGQRGKATEKIIGPFLREFGRKSERKKAGQRLAAHGGNIAQSASQAAVAYASGWVPLAAKVNLFNGKVRRDKQFVAGRNTHDGAIVADPPAHRAVSALGRQSPDTLNQLFFRGNQYELNYIEKKGLLPTYLVSHAARGGVFAGNRLLLRVLTEGHLRLCTLIWGPAANFRYLPSR